MNKAKSKVKKQEAVVEKNVDNFNKAVIDSNIADQEVDKKPRGRPRKNVAQNTTKKPRGRPRKNVAQNTAENPAQKLADLITKGKIQRPQRENIDENAPIGNTGWTAAKIRKVLESR